MAERLSFVKMQGVGNDFVVVDGRSNGEANWSALAIELCNRRTGVGADGLLVIDTTRSADIMMRMYNPDGTPDVCGNGLRCVARYAVDRGIVAGGSLRVATLAGVRDATIRRAGRGSRVEVTVGMGLPRFDPPSIPMRVAMDRVVDYPLQLALDDVLSVTAMSTGSTHAVTFVDALPTDDRFNALSPLVEHHLLFPERTSLMWCRVDGPGRLALRIWERGVGETWGCGTGACAAAVAAVLHGHAPAGEPISVVSHGGELQIRWTEGGAVEMTGPAEFVFEGAFYLDS